MKGRGRVAAAKVQEVERRAESGEGSGKARNEVSVFLSSMGLAVYSSLFLREGIEDLETMQELTDSHLASLGLPVGHRLKLLKRLKDLREPCSIPEPIAPIAEPVTALLGTVKKNRQGGREGVKEQSTYEMYRVAIEEFRRTGMEEKESRWGKGQEAKPIPSPVQPKSPLLLPTSKPIEPKRPAATETCSYCHQSFPKGQVSIEEGKVYCSKACLEELQKAEIEVRNEAEFSGESSEQRAEGKSEGSGEVEAIPTDETSREKAVEFEAYSGQFTPSLKPAPLPVPNRSPLRLKKKPPAPPKLPNPSSERSLLESSEQVRGWDAPVEASFDLGRNEE